MTRIRNKLGKILESIISDHMIKRSKDLIASRTTTGIDKAEEQEEEEDFVDVLLKLQESNKLEFNFTTDQIKAVIMGVRDISYYHRMDNVRVDEKPRVKKKL
ncbi:premnaspirodiene oxygenase [Prunus yedoensis var. nudiflora]|uniref:Premnaspirodiene oxygenase n=1 Tax=Prunus yedoensis var. nudiflora TaxID=2094558 RepID=A0A314XT44_PRUYE|nr:premnaspirodiene oxygenase [Prunus yedoensis var. nudiflora]